jgi:hypothetical protein
MQKYYKPRCNPVSAPRVIASACVLLTLWEVQRSALAGCLDPSMRVVLPPAEPKPEQQVAVCRQ